MQHQWGRPGIATSIFLKLFYFIEERTYNGDFFETAAPSGRVTDESDIAESPGRGRVVLFERRGISLTRRADPGAAVHRYGRERQPANRVKR
jgi:hypothetical protein